jgi:hypothetical protein
MSDDQDWQAKRDAAATEYVYPCFFLKDQADAFSAGADFGRAAGRAERDEIGVRLSMAFEAQSELRGQLEKFKRNNLRLAEEKHEAKAMSAKLAAALKDATYAAKSVESCQALAEYEKSLK